MKRFGLIIMVLGFLATLNSTFFSIINKQINPAQAILFWGLLTVFEFYSAWTVLSSKTKSAPLIKALTFVGFSALAITWLLLVLNDPHKKAIIVWAVKILYYSGLYFMGLILCYRDKSMQNS